MLSGLNKVYSKQLRSYDPENQKQEKKSTITNEP